MSDDGDLGLSDDVRAQLAAAQARYERTRHLGEGERGVDADTPPARSFLVGVQLQPCPFGAPPMPISTEYHPVTGDLYLRCLHQPSSPGPHCWDLSGSRLSGCP